MNPDRKMLPLVLVAGALALFMAWMAHVESSGPPEDPVCESGPSPEATRICMAYSQDEAMCQPDDFVELCKKVYKKALAGHGTWVFSLVMASAALAALTVCSLVIMFYPRDKKDDSTDGSTDEGKEDANLKED
ncbi:MAG: hypothetical protein MPK62_00280 [Alphaproteobacteria bacterium]|nr:hypothetical protein [Alphaproteobacteria bacterium]MDA8029574.1 hypothetical protein [Alphaproteobacteria bacterium]